MKSTKTLKTKAVSVLMTIALTIGMTISIFATNIDPVPTVIMTKGTSKQNAASLIESANKALTYTIKASKESKNKKMNMDNKDAAPYWKALKSLNTELNKTERGVMLKDDSFFTGMAAALSTSEELKIVFQMLNIEDANIKKGINQTADAVNLLYITYSKEAKNKDSNKPLTAQERKQLESLKSKQKELQAKLTEMEKKMGKNAEGVKELRKKSKELQNAQNNRNDYFWAMHTFNMMHGWMWGWHWSWGPWGGWCPGYSVIIVDSYYDYYSFYDGYDWGYMDAVIDMDYALDYEMDLMELDYYSDYINDYEYSAPDYYDGYDIPETFDQGTYEDLGGFDDSYDIGGYDDDGGIDDIGW